MANKIKAYKDLGDSAKQDIVTLYRGCKDQREQIKICAELHSTTVGVVRYILEENGLEVPPYPGRKVSAGKTSPPEAERQLAPASPPACFPFARVEELIASCHPDDSRDVRATYRMLALQLCEQVVNDLFGGFDE